MKKDVFISYKNDGEGNNFAARLTDDLEKRGYRVYFNSHEQRSGSFPERLKNAIAECTDFVLVLSEGCLNQLIENREIDWIREEILTARGLEKNIIPIIIGRAVMPSNKAIMPEKLQFLPDLDAVFLPEQYTVAPISNLELRFESNPNESDDYSLIANNNENFDVCAFMRSVEKQSGIMGGKEYNSDALFKLGCLYYYGIASPESPHGKMDFAKATECFEKVAELGGDLAVKAKFMLGNMHYFGVIPNEEQSFKRALEYYSEVTETNPELSLEKMVFMMSDGIGTRFNLEEIEKCFKRCKGSNSAKNTMSKFYMNYGMFAEAIEVLESMDEGHPDAEYKLGQIYLRGVHENPPRPDVYRAEHYFRKAAENNNLDAIHALGLMNFRGQYGFPKNFYKARELYKDAAQKGHRGAQYDYAWMCKYGLGGDRDIKSAIIFFEKSAQRAHVLSAYELSTLYQEPEYRNYKKAFEWAFVAAEAGMAHAEYILGNLYLLGRGCEADESKARIYYNRAKKHGFDVAEQMIDAIDNKGQYK